jgi:HSP20 family protein
VLETDSSVDIEIDVPGVGVEGLRVVIKNGVVIIAGEKLPRDSSQRADGSFHLVERGFGHFARAVRLTGAFDGAAARATLQAGELHIVIPKMRERRGGEIVVPIVQNDPQEVAASGTGAGTPTDHT